MADLGILAADLELAHAHDDGPNQPGDLARGRNSDYTSFTPQNPVPWVIDPRRVEQVIDQFQQQLARLPNV